MNPTTSRRLELSYNWQRPVVLASGLLVVCGVVVIGSGINGRFGAVAVLVAMWAAYSAVIWSRTRALMILDGHWLTVRRVRRTHLVDGRKVRSVREYLTNNGASYTVRLVGDPHAYFVPTALLRDGRSTFFTWLLSYAPAAELDKRSRRSVDQLRSQGLIAPNGPSGPDRIGSDDEHRVGSGGAR